MDALSNLYDWLAGNWTRQSVPRKAVLGGLRPASFHTLHAGILDRSYAAYLICRISIDKRLSKSYTVHMQHNCKSGD
ncbi:MAG: hypothetical protein Kow002_10960 [Anaerolineales bacterium]